jgi:hypothetical protein
MDILYVVPYVPNLIRVRPYNLIRHLSDAGITSRCLPCGPMSGNWRTWKIFVAWFTSCMLSTCLHGARW